VARHGLGLASRLDPAAHKGGDAKRGHTVGTGQVAYRPRVWLKFAVGRVNQIAAAAANAALSSMRARCRERAFLMAHGTGRGQRAGQGHFAPRCRHQQRQGKGVPNRARPMPERHRQITADRAHPLAKPTPRPAGAVMAPLVDLARPAALASVAPLKGRQPLPQAPGNRRPRPTVADCRCQRA